MEAAGWGYGACARSKARSPGTGDRRNHIEWAIPKAMLIAMNAVPPADMNGNGSPVIGMTPTVMPTLTNTWNVISAAAPTATS